MYIPQSIENIINAAIVEAKKDNDENMVADHIVVALENWPVEDLLEVGRTLEITVSSSSYMFGNGNAYDLEGLIRTAVNYKVWLIAHQRIKGRKPSLFLVSDQKGASNGKQYP